MMRENWIEATLGEVCNINMGQSPPSSTYNTEKIGLPFFQGKAEFTTLHPVVIKWCSDPKKIANENDILLSVRAPVGTTNVANQKCAIGRGLAAISYSRNYKYILYYLKLIERKLDSQGTGTTFKAISGNILKSQTIPIPPLPEQRAIVAKVEQLFSELDNGIANLKAAKDKLEIFRQAVMEKAFEGELTRNSSRPKDWKQETLGNVIERIEAGKSFRCEERPPQQNETGILKVSAVTWGKFQEEESKTVTDESKINPAYFVQKGDFLLSRANTLQLVGNTVIVRRIQKKLMLSDKTLRISFNSNTSDWFILYFLRSHEGRKQIEALSTGNQVSMRNIGQARIKQIKFPCPPTLEEQTQIVQEIETRLSVCDNAIANIEESLTKAEALRQSILKKAFAGKLLTNTELQACRQEPDWEPAAKLLERIKHDKKSTPRKKSTT